jgi:hypothetical protein
MDPLLFTLFVYDGSIFVGALIIITAIGIFASQRGKTPSTIEIRKGTPLAALIFTGIAALLLAGTLKFGQNFLESSNVTDQGEFIAHMPYIVELAALGTTAITSLWLWGRFLAARRVPSTSRPNDS